MAAKKTFIPYQTPVGVAVYPKLHKAYKWDDAADKSLPNPDGDYVTELRLSNKDAQGLLADIQTAIKSSGVKPKHVPFKEDDKNDGFTIFKHKGYGKTKDGDINKIKFFDSNGEPIKGTVKVTAGSKLRIKGWISVAKMGARLNIRAVQIIELAEEQGEGFDACEGGTFKRADLNEDESFEDEVTEKNEAEETTSDDQDF